MDGKMGRVKVCVSRKKRPEEQTSALMCSISRHQVIEKRLMRIEKAAKTSNTYESVGVMGASFSSLVFIILALLNANFVLDTKLLDNDPRGGRRVMLDMVQNGLVGKRSLGGNIRSFRSLIDSVRALSTRRISNKRLLLSFSNNFLGLALRHVGIHRPKTTV